MFWSFIILVFVTMLVGDTGFLKLGAVIGVITGVLILVFQMVNNTSTYDLMKSDNYTLIVETDSSPGERSVNVYTKDSLFFSKYVGNVKIQDIYDTSYEMIGDSFIINKCTLNSCVTVEIDLN